MLSLNSVIDLGVLERSVPNNIDRISDDFLYSSANPKSVPIKEIEEQNEKIKGIKQLDYTRAKYSREDVAFLYDDMGRDESILE
ncbi:hypothetical protein Tco_0345203 [Tanacetum coccineum]